MKKLELFYFPQCPYCQIVESALKVTGLEGQVTYYNTNKDPAAKERLKRETGKTMVPCLFIDGKPMFESQDIAAWLHQYAKEIKSHGGALRGN